MDYPKFGSIPRLHKPITITEKIDGTNGCIYIPVDNEVGYGLSPAQDLAGESDPFSIFAGSRSRWLTVESDNYAFAAWVKANAQTLVADLGPGLHYGEWWGSGIQCGYGLTKGEKRFSLFNTKRWGSVDNGVWYADKFRTPHLRVVPVLHWEVDAHRWNDYVHDALEDLRINGSVAAPGFMRPEGVVIYHSASNQLFKAFVEDDDIPKTVAAQRVSTVKAKGAVDTRQLSTNAKSFEKGVQESMGFLPPYRALSGQTLRDRMEQIYGGQK